MSDQLNTTYVVREKDEETGQLLVHDILQFDLSGDPKLDRRRFMRTIGQLYNRMHEDESLSELTISFRGE